MPIFSQRRISIVLLALVGLATIAPFSFYQVSAVGEYGDADAADDDYYSEYVKEVLEEDQENQQHENEYYHEDSYYERQEEQQKQAESQRRAEEERIAQEQSDRVAAERERAFQAELDRMNAEQQKAALKQKKKDAQIVKSVLKASQKEDLYQVLGIRNWNLKIPSRNIRIPIVGYSLTIPGITVKETTMKDIRKAYRNRAMAVHPDKNKDGRAQEAFILVEESASTLSDNFLRQQYDKALQIGRREKRESQLELVSGVVRSIQGTIVGLLKAARVILGPFATPVIILGLLMA